MIPGLTIAIAVVVMALMLVLSPGRALGVIIASMLFWPEYLRIPLAVVQMSVPRAAALVLLARLIMTKPASGGNESPLMPGGGAAFRWTIVDGLVIAGWAWDVCANAMVGADEVQMIQMIGRILDTVLMYFTARLALRTLWDFRAAVLPIVATGVVVGGLGVSEAVMARSVYDPLYAFGGMPWFDKDAEFRYGFLRARGSASHSIYFGVAMALIVGLLWSMRGVAKSKWLVWIGILAAFLGSMSSLSSGPQIALVTLMLCGAFYYVKWAIKPAVAMLVFMCVTVELASNRHFFQLADYLALSSETAWYRGRLMEVAAERVGEYWIAGLGGVAPHHWGALIDSRLHVDVVNHFIIVALNGGLLSLGIFLAIQIMSIRSCARISKRTRVPAMRALAFGLACTLIMLMVASLSIGLFGPPLLITYMLMGAMSAVGAWEGSLATMSRKTGASVARMPVVGNGTLAAALAKSDERATVDERGSESGGTQDPVGRTGVPGSLA